MNHAAGAAPDFQDRRVLVFDTELTDLPDRAKEPPEIIQHAWIELEPAAHISAFFLLEKPELEDFMMQCACHDTDRCSSPGALAVHGFLPEDVKGLPKFSVDDDLGGPGVVLIGHSIDVDWNAARRYAAKAPTAGDDMFPVEGEARTVLDDVPRICTLAMARRIYGPTVQHSLGALMFHIHGVNAETRDRVRGAHDAGADVFMTMQLLFDILKRKPEIRSWKALWEFSEDSRLPRFWPLGKYGPKDNGGVGQPLEAARYDHGYCDWVRDTFWKKDPYLVRAVDLMQRGELTP
jgi:exodeoxyribonuclease X